ncbi:unnamed protein product [Microthlaspi erraticum]|uniref:Pectinesterase inhibitor domain-containing protein n=1 Tax=Microthlaspi erraticum TaxID=1685480 RepID=A0A6D2HQ21_9BRAS|nr:unnamed protein product [Microthlaspi erraticum]
MNNIMKLFSIFVVFIQIQIALSQPDQSPPIPNSDIGQLCRANIYPSLCLSTLNLDPRSKTATSVELSVISVDATSKKVNEMLEYLKSVNNNTKNGEDSTRYSICSQAYTMAAKDFLPFAYSLLKDHSFVEARSEMLKVVSASDKCAAQFAGSSPLTQRIKVIHDTADMSADIMRYFIANS